MKREILFKARRADGEGWVEGDLVRYKNTPLDIDITSIIKADGLKHAVLPNTVCQYTGLKDQNGLRIFEGDVVTAMTLSDEHWENEKSEYSIGYSSGTFCFVKDGRTARQWKDGTNDWYSIENNETFDIEVTGNIHDND
jgi:uncharacterized phage protein (TIGR01671 family)